MNYGTRWHFVCLKNWMSMELAIDEYGEYGRGFYDGYDAPYPTLPAVASEHD